MMVALNSTYLWKRDLYLWLASTFLISCAEQRSGLDFTLHRSGGGSVNGFVVEAQGGVSPLEPL